ncbi:MucR family transcriptional regulator [uncultured Enterovirga sp.]|uniref:MucR family transcriptional regulator n=1 Tax=uncultured Enterovirga sp. TaxID=2026352 RepID=UPI0035CACA17
MEPKSDKSRQIVALTADLVSAYVGNNAVRAGDLEGLISSVNKALAALELPPPTPEAPTLTPPVSIKRSVTPDYLISLEDGKRYKTLKRHLSGRGLTAAQYREKWGLPSDYPMVAPNYTMRRSELAKTSGFGRKAVSEEAGSTSRPNASPETETDPAQEAA